MVISKSGCSSSLYGEIKIFDSSDIQIDYTNDSTSTVSPMQKVKLTFDTFNDQADSAQIGELKCYWTFQKLLHKNQRIELDKLRLFSLPGLHLSEISRLGLAKT